MPSFLDTVLRTLPDLARKVYPGRVFRFSCRFIDDKREPVYQVTMTAEQGQGGSTVFYCQGESPLSTDAAAEKLVASFVTQVEQDGTRQEAGFDDAKAQHGLAMARYEEGRRAALLIKRPAEPENLDPAPLLA